MKIFLIFFLMISSSYSNYSYREGDITKDHDQEFLEKKERFITTNGSVDVVKVKQSISYFKQNILAIRNSFFMNRYYMGFNEYFEDEKKARKSADKKVGKKRDSFLVYTEVLDGLERLIGEQDDIENIDEEIARITILISSIYTPFNETIFTEDLTTLKNVYEWFFNIDKVTKKPHAANLLRKGKLISYSEIKSEFKRGTLDLLDPPSSPFWENNIVESYDPENEAFDGHMIFPPSDTPFHFKRVATGTIKFKAYWKFFNGEKVKSKDVTIRLGREVHSGVLSSHLMKSVGYHTIPTVYRKKVKLFLGKTSYEEFVARWRKAHGLSVDNALTYIKEYNEQENYIVLKNVALEGYPSKKYYRKNGPFRTARNGFENRREYRAQLAMAALISLNDTADRQVRMDFYRSSKKKQWTPRFFISDLGWTMGSYLIWDNMGAVNDYLDEITDDKEDRVDIKWFSSSYNPGYFQATTYEDMRWIIRRMLRISNEQLLKMTLSAGFPQAVAELYVTKIRKRINKMAKDFGLKNVIEHKIRKSYLELHKDFPKLINKKGKVTYEIEKDLSTNISMIAYYSAPIEALTVFGGSYLVSLVQDEIKSFGDLGLDTEYKAKNIKFTNGLSIGPSRKITINKNKDVDEKRFLVIDKYEISIPIGIFGESFLGTGVHIELPLNLSYKYTFTHYKSFDSLKDAYVTDFFNSSLPWAFSFVREKMGDGEILDIKKELGVGVGSFALSFKNIVDLNVSPLAFHYKKLDQTFISKKRGLWEIITNAQKNSDFKSNVSFRGFLKFHLGANTYDDEQKFRLYRSYSDISKDVEKAFSDAAFYNNFNLLEKITPTYEIVEKKNGGSLHFGAFIWSKYYSSDFRDISLTSNQVKYKNERRKVFVAEKSSLFERDYGGIKDLELGINESVNGILGYFGQVINNKSSKSLKIEALLTKDELDFEQMQMKFEIEKSDNWVSRKDLMDDFVKYFERRSGVTNYYNYQAPVAIENYSPVVAKMSWMFKKEAIFKMLEFLRSKRSLCSKVCERDFQVLDGLTHIRSKRALRIKLKTYSKLLYRAFGPYGIKTKRFVKRLDESEYFIYSFIEGVLSNLGPVHVNKKNKLFARPIGKFIGYSYLDKYKHQKFFTSHGDYNLIPYPIDLY